jgi:hypothetical protein
MKIELISREKPIKKQLYKLAHKYKPIIQKEIEGMLSAEIIYPINKSEWESPMVVQLKNNNPKKLRICIDFGGINKLTLMNSFPTPFANKIINEFVGHECYSFIDIFLGYNHFPIDK